MKLSSILAVILTIAVVFCLLRECNIMAASNSHENIIPPPPDSYRGKIISKIDEWSTKIDIRAKEKEKRRDAQ